MEIFRRHAGDFRSRAGVDVEIARFADLDPARAAALELSADSFTTDARELISDPSLDVIVELIGGISVARELVLEALRSGKSVVTANKALMASHGQEVMRAAEEHGVDILFEASVGGGIPIISPLKHCLVSNEVLSVIGIVNGTTNYMLTRMAEDGLDYAAALAEAQSRGYAEADPSADVDGLDAAAKIAILASIAFNSRVTLAQVPCEGIGGITREDIAYASEMGFVLKLLAIARRVSEEVDVRVHPALIRTEHPLAAVRGVYNAIYVVGDSVGETMFFGEGAGALPAASAVVGDVIEVARHIGGRCLGLVGCTCSEEHRVRPIEELETSYYIRMQVNDSPGVLAAVAKVFGDHGVSIASVIQKGALGEVAEIVWVTHKAKESDVRSALGEIDGLDVLESIVSVIRVEEI